MPARKPFWQAAGTLLGELRTRRGWTRPELAARAGLSTDLVTVYETDPDRFPQVEAWWRLTTALGVDLGTFLRHVETRSGVRLLHDVRLPQAAGGQPHGRPGALAPREDTARGADRQTTDELSSFVDQLRDKPPEEDGR